MTMRAMARRGFLGALAAIGATRAAAVTAPGRTAGIVGMVGTNMRRDEGVEVAGPCIDAQWSRLQALQKPIRRANRRRAIALELMGGVPPHLATMHSNAPWFRAQRAAVFLEGEEHSTASLMDRLYRDVMGDR